MIVDQICACLVNIVCGYIPLAAMENALRLNGEIEVKHYQQGVGLTNQYNYFAKTFIRLESRVGLANLFQLVDSINYWSDRVILQ